MLLISHLYFESNSFNSMTSTLELFLKAKDKTKNSLIGKLYNWIDISQWNAYYRINKAKTSSEGMHFTFSLEKNLKSINHVQTTY